MKSVAKWIGDVCLGVSIVLFGVVPWIYGLHAIVYAIREMSAAH